jgi:uncharacterized protein (TIGR03437 family)
VGSLDPASPGGLTINVPERVCDTYATFLHELGHSIGLIHEHQRPDRDNYIQIFLGNSAFGTYNFDINPYTDISEPYDLLSIMHYAWNQGSMNLSLPTMLPRDKSKHWEIVEGYGRRVTDLDAAKIAELYAGMGLVPAGRGTVSLNSSPIELVAVEGTGTSARDRVRIQGAFSSPPYEVEVDWMTDNGSILATAGDIVSTTAGEIQFRVPTFDKLTPAWIRVARLGEKEQDTLSVPAYAVFPQGTTGVAGSRLDPVEGPAQPQSVFNAASRESAKVPRLARSSYASFNGKNFSTAFMTVATVNPSLPDGFDTDLPGTGIKVTLSDPDSGASWPCPIQSVAQVWLGGKYLGRDQVNFVVPKAAQLGPLNLTVTKDGQTIGSSQVWVMTAAPGIYTTNWSGTSFAAGQVVYDDDGGTRHTQDIASGSPESVQPIPIDVRAANASGTFVVLYVNGLRGRTDQRNVRVDVDGVAAQVAYADDQKQYVGLDQLNIILPREVAGRGRVSVHVTVDGVAAPPVDLFVL